MRDPREEAIRLARRLADPAAVCAALAVFRARGRDEAEAHRVGERMVRGGMLSESQLGRILGEAPLSAPPATSAHEPVEAAHLDPLPHSTAVAVLEDERPASLGHDPAEASAPAFAVPDAMHPLGAGVAPRVSSPEEPVGLPRWLPVAAGLVGVLLALVTWLPLDGAKMAPAAPTLQRPGAPPPSVVASVPRPPLPPPRPAPAWPAGLRDVCVGDSSALIEGLRSLERQLKEASEPMPIAFAVQDALRRRVKRDKLVAWVELSLERYPVLSDVRSRHGCPSAPVHVGWMEDCACR